MCWSPEASLALGVAGVATAAVAARTSKNKALSITLVYFSLMEFLQFFSYSSIGQCGVSVNQTLTFLSYIHIVISPFFFNLFYLETMARAVRARTKAYVYAACGVFSLLLAVKVVPFSPGALCTVGETLCGPAWCTVSGTWHLAWQIPTYTWPLPGDLALYYALAVFALPLFYGAWRGVLFAAAAPVVAYAMTPNPNEWPAVWCLFSVALIFLTLLHPRIRHQFFPDMART